MYLHRTILCPVDFSDASAGALRCAVAIASALDTRLIVATVEDPLLTEALDLGTGVIWSLEDCRRELVRFATRALDRETGAASALEYDVAVGRPASEILRIARERSCDLIVMSSRGLTGARKLFFGSTTERVLRETSCPVLVTPSDVKVTGGAAGAGRAVGRILVPVDLSVHSPDHVRVAAAIGEAISVPLVLVHVLEPVRTWLAARLQRTGIQAERRAAADDRLNELAAAVPAGVHTETLLAYGDPAEELSKIAEDRRVGLIVMGLQASRVSGPRTGSVTYRMLCLLRTAVLAIPPAKAAAAEERAATTNVAGIAS